MKSFLKKKEREDKWPMNLEISFTSHVPIYVQLTDQIKHKIATGDLKPGDQLPTVRQLAADLRVNFNTIARGYRILDEEGIISTQHGRGTFILELQSEEQAETLLKDVLRQLTSSYLFESQRLGYSAEEVKQIVNKKLDIWKKEGTTPSPDSENK
jgi:GntR family transcriptional regulator